MCMQHLSRSFQASPIVGWRSRSCPGSRHPSRAGAEPVDLEFAKVPDESSCVAFSFLTQSQSSGLCVRVLCRWSQMFLSPVPGRPWVPTGELQGEKRVDKNTISQKPLPAELALLVVSTAVPVLSCPQNSPP